MSDRLRQERINAELKELQKSVTQGGMSRRRFLAAAMAMGVGAMVPALYSEALRAAPKKGGRIRVGLTGGATSDTLDPGQILDLYMLSLQFGQLRNGLTEVSASGELIPELAESWEASKDAKTWNFKIRSGVEFSNGKSLTVEDVIDSLNHHLTKDSKSAAKAILAGVDSIKADGKSNVIVTLKGGDADFPFLLTDYHIGICPSKGDGTIDWESGIGTGGYVLKEHEAGVRSLTTRNPNYWKENSAFFDEIEQLQIADPSSRSNALRTGSLDAMNNVETKTVERMKKLPGIQVRATTGNKQITLPMRTDTAPFDNADVRTAVKLSIDREQWLQKVIRGYGELGNDNPIGPANIYRATTDELPQRAYDPEKAKHHLKKAGHDKLKIQFHAANTGFGGAVDAAQLMRETAAASGIDVEVVREPDDGYWSNVWMKKPFVACYWSGRATENWMFSQVYAADAKWNDTFWKHEKFNKLLLEARAELEPKKRREMYVEMQQILHNDGGLCLPLFQSDVMAYSDKLNVPEVVGNNWELDGGKFADRWSFA
ncbi:MAG: ABC transporter substrate-binding protein [Thiolinea sp.]